MALTSIKAGAPTVAAADLFLNLTIRRLSGYEGVVTSPSKKSAKSFYFPGRGQGVDKSDVMQS